MANLITLSRLLMLVAVILALYAGPGPQLVAFFVLIALFLTDTLDGYVARRRGEESLFGAVFDIAADRIVELSLWIVFAHLGAIPVWIPLVFVARGTLTDAIRAVQTSATGTAPFAAVRSPLARFLVAGKFMRTGYAVIKAVTFCTLTLSLPAATLLPESWQMLAVILAQLGLALAILSVVLCLARGLPVIVEFALAEAKRP